MPYRKSRLSRGLDRSNPLAAGLIFAAYVDPSTMTALDYVSGAVGTPSAATGLSMGFANTAGGTAVPGSEKQQMLLTAGTTSIQWPRYATLFDKLATGANHTIMVVASSAVSTNQVYPIFTSSDELVAGNGSGILIDQNAIAGPGRIIAYQDGLNRTGGTVDNMLTAAPSGKPHAFGCSWLGATQQFYYQGHLTTTPTGSVQPSAQVNRRTKFFSGYNTITKTAYVSYAFVWNRVLTVQEYANWWRDPGALLLLPNRRRIISLGATSGSVASPVQSAGVGTGLATGASAASGNGLSSGVGAGLGTGAAAAADPGASAGVGTGLGVGASTVSAAMVSAGVGTATAVGASQTGAATAGDGYAAGVATANAQGASTVTAIARAAGVGTARAVGAGGTHGNTAITLGARPTRTQRMQAKLDAEQDDLDMHDAARAFAQFLAERPTIQ